MQHIGRGDDDPPAGQLPITRRLEKIFLMSEEDAETLGHRAVGTQHLLIGLLHEGQGAAHDALRALGAPPEQVWVSAFRQLGADAPPYVPAGLPSMERQRPAAPVAEWIPKVAVAGGASFLVGLFLGWLIWGT